MYVYAQHDFFAAIDGLIDNIDSQNVDIEWWLDFKGLLGPQSASQDFFVSLIKEFCNPTKYEALAQDQPQMVRAGRSWLWTQYREWLLSEKDCV